MQQPQDILVDAYKLIGETGRTRGTYARNVDGDPVYTLSPDGHVYCAVGAILVTAEKLQATPEAAQDALTALQTASGTLVSLPEWNDLATDQEVSYAFQQALAQTLV